MRWLAVWDLVREKIEKAFLLVGKLPISLKDHSYHLPFLISPCLSPEILTHKLPYGVRGNQSLLSYKRLGSLQ